MVILLLVCARSMFIMKWFIEDFVYGATDDAVTTFAVVVGVIGAVFSPSVILILGFAKLFVDGFAMARRKKRRWEYKI
ncbi:MAG TPA: VIT1/CCC1 transporter family protein [Candidatus Nitrosocosmicus sp.]|nr:VIT1/CCC1 transporter family protein [Candidatus Nitrosocosmicus sp.]